MAKTKVNRKVPKSLGLPRAGGRRMTANAARMGSSMDMATQRYIKLLSDPCAADLTAPTYGGTGSGYLMRTKQFVTPLNTSVDGVFEYTPSWASFAMRLCVASSLNGTLSASTGTTVPSGLISIADCWRPVAACVKVYYTGSEQNRSGMICGNLLDGPSLGSGEAPLGTALGFAQSAARFTRLGSEMHEYRWCPNESDQNFTTVNSAVPDNAFKSGSTLQVGFIGVPAGTVSFEVTTVWEWQPVTGTSGGNIVSTPRAPASPLALNATLHRLGNLADWATRPANQMKMLKFGQGIYNTYKTVRPALAALTL